MKNSEWLIAEILNCGTTDLEVIDRIKADYIDITEIYNELCCSSDDSRPSIRILFDKCVSIALEKMQETINELIEENEDDEVIKHHLIKLNPKSDFDVYYNALASTVTCVANNEIYSYHPELIDDFRYDIGITIGNI